MNWFFSILLIVVILTGCSTVPLATTESAMPKISPRALCDAGKFHEAMRILPVVMEEWADYARRTGETAEGAAGFEYASTLGMIAEKGDAHWGKVLDDPEIPYEYKTAMIFEVIESRLGKGSIWSFNENIFVIPQSGKLSSWEEMKTLLRQTLQNSE